MGPVTDQFICHLAAGGTILTANRRQSRIIRRLFDESRVAAGHRCWPSADVLPLEAWLSARWAELAADDPSLPVQLGDPEALWPWRLTAPRFLDSVLVDVAQLSSAARRAWLQLGRYGGTLGAMDGAFMSRDQRQFLAWAREVETRLAAQGWIDPGQLEVALAARAHRLAPGRPLLLAGFHRPAPSLRRLAEHLSAAGTPVAWTLPRGTPVEGRRHEAEDPADETRAWLAWARHRLEADPAARLAVVVPDLQSRRASIERALDAHLHADLELPGNRERDRAYDLAGAEPLAATGLAAAALDCLQCLAPRLAFEPFSRLLRSRHTPAGDEADPRVRLDVELRRRGLASWPLESLATFARRSGCEGVARALDVARALLQEGPQRRPTDGWARTLGTLLAAWGWPGAGTLASDEYQAAEALRDRLDEFARLARAAPPLTLDQALAEFRQLVAAPFQPERGTPSLWVLDVLEPAGVEFDGLWVSGLTATAWPAAARQEAFLPLPLQQALGMPGVSAEDALADAQATLDAWCRSTAELVFSWPRQQDDAVVEPSRLLPAGSPTLDLVARPATRAELTQRVATLEPAVGDRAPPLAGAAQGGARILDLQAKCPFRAFAELRLGARRLEEPVAGVDARVRGNVLHAALEQVWHTLRDRAGLDRLDSIALESLVAQSLARAVSQELPAEIGARARQLEWDWQHAAILNALAADRGRAPFEVVEAEEELTADLDGLRLRLRVDRVDRVSGGLVVLDYKTGWASTTQWRGTRPDAPQLPLYAVLKGGDVGGVAFFAVDAHAAALRGVACEAQRLDGMQAAERFALTDDREKGFNWPEIRARWHDWLSRLARDHLRGVADVDPKLPQTCRNCHLATLCRVPPAFEASDLAEEEAGDD